MDYQISTVIVSNSIQPVYSVSQSPSQNVSYKGIMGPLGAAVGVGAAIATGLSLWYAVLTGAIGAWLFDNIEAGDGGGHHKIVSGYIKENYGESALQTPLSRHKSSASKTNPKNNNPSECLDELLADNPLKQVSSAKYKITELEVGNNQDNREIYDSDLPADYKTESSSQNGSDSSSDSDEAPSENSESNSDSSAGE